MRFGGFNIGRNRNLPQEIEQWYHIPAVLGTIFTLIGVHFFDLFKLIIIAAILEFSFAILKYIFVSSFKIIYYSIGHSIILWIWSIGTLVYFIIVGPWWLGAYALGYHIFIGSIIGLPGILIVDGIAGKILGKHPKYYAAERFYGHQIEEDTKKMGRKSNKIDATEIGKYLKEVYKKTLFRLTEYKVNEFTKQWINEAIIAVFDEVEEFLLSLRKIDRNDLGSLSLFIHPSKKSLAAYVKLNILHLVIVGKYDSDFCKVLKWADLEFEDFKNSVFKFFKFGNKLKSLYSDLDFGYKNNEVEGALEAYSKTLYNNFILLAFNRELNILDDSYLMADLAAHLFLMKSFNNSLSSLVRYLTEYFKELKSHFKREH